MEEPSSRRSESRRTGSPTKRPETATKSPTFAKVGGGEIDTSVFHRVLVLYSDKGQRKGIWFPIEFISGDVIPKTLAVVTADQLKGIDYPKDINGNKGKILVSDSPLSRAEILSLPSETDDFYEKMELRLTTQDKMGLLTKKVADKALVEIYVRITTAARDYTKKGTQSRPDGIVWNEAYEEKEIQIDDLEQKINTQLSKEFKKLQYQLYTPIDLHENKMTAFANIFNLLARAYREEIRDREREIREKMAAGRQTLRKMKPAIEEYLKTLIDDNVDKRLSKLLNENELSDEELIDTLNIVRYTGSKELGTKLQEVFSSLYEQKWKMGKLQRLKWKFDHSNTPILESRREITANRIMLWNLLTQALRSPDLCGFLKYLSLIEDQAVFHAMQVSRQPPLETIQKASKMLGREETREILNSVYQVDGNEAYIFAADNPVVWGTLPITTLSEAQIAAKRQMEAESAAKASTKPRTELPIKEPSVKASAKVNPKPAGKRSAKPKEKIDLETPMDKVNRLTKLLLRLVDYYTSDLLKDIDLSDTVVTGSIIPATLGLLVRQITVLYPDYHFTVRQGISVPKYSLGNINLDLSKINIEDLEYSMLQFYPPLYSKPSNLEKYRKLMEQGRYRVSSNKISDLSGRQQVKIEEEDGADIDLAVLSDDPQELDEIAQRHFKVWKEKYPDIEMVKVDKVKKYLWEINGLPRKVQIYPSSLRQIMSHHLAMVRGFIFGNGDERMVYCSANCMMSLRTMRSPNYYYFAGIKSPVETILKYEQRGYLVTLPTNLRKLIVKYSEMEPRWQNKILQIINRLNDWWLSLKGRPKNYDIELRKLYDIYTSSRFFSALLGWGNFDVTFLQEEERDFNKVAGYNYSELSYEKIHNKITEGGFYKAPRSDEEEEEEEEEEEDEDDE